MKDTIQQPKIPAGIWILLIAMATGSFAGSVLATAVGLQVFDISGREFDLGLIGIVSFVPILLLSAFTGTVADRFDRRHVYRAGLTINMAAVAGLLFLALTDRRRVGLILICMAVYSTGRALGWPAGRALPIDMAPEESLERVVALRSLGFQISLIIGPLVAAFANKASIVLPFVIVLAAQLIAFVLIGLVPTPDTERLVSDTGPRQALIDAINGLRFIRRSPVVLGAIALDLFAVLFGGAVALMPAIVEKRLGWDDVDLGVGILNASIAAAAATTAAVLSIRPLRRHVGRMLFIVIAVFGAATILLGATTSFPIAVVAVAIFSAADQISVFIRSSLLPLATPEAMRGRVLAVENIFIGGSNQLGAFESGVTASLFGLGPAVVLGGAGTLVVVAAAYKMFPTLAAVDRFLDVKPDVGPQDTTS